MSPSIAEIRASNAQDIASNLQIDSHPAKVKAAVTNGHPTHVAELDASSISVTLAESARDEINTESLLSDSPVTTDHMITAQWTLKNGWQRPELKPFGPLSLMPTANVLHYATTCFEGMKLYRGFDGALRLFRPTCNANRMLLSANRIALPSFPPEELLKLIVNLCAVDGPKWLPRSQPGRMLYIRPTLIGDDPSVGVQRPRQALLFILLCSSPTAEATKDGIKLIASEEESSGVRAWPGGHGWAKVGANYGPTLLAQGQAAAEGFTQVLWLLHRHDGRVEVTEAGASNFFVVWKTRDGQLEMVTAPLGERVILDGVTRRSILQLSRERLESSETLSSREPGVETIKVSERPLEMREMEEAVAEGRMVEAFAAGTAFFVSPVSLIRYHGKDLAIPMAEGSTGTYARILKGWLSDIMYGKEKHEWAYEIKETPA